MTIPGANTHGADRDYRDYQAETETGTGTGTTRSAGSLRAAMIATSGSACTWCTAKGTEAQTENGALGLGQARLACLGAVRSRRTLPRSRRGQEWRIPLLALIDQRKRRSVRSESF